MYHIERPSSLAIHMPLSTRVMVPVVSALEQISLSSSHCNRHPSPPPPSQSEDMITDKDQIGSQVSKICNSLVVEHF